MRSFLPTLGLFCLSIGFVAGVLVACAAPSQQEHPNDSPSVIMSDDPTLTYLALGDSYTIGESVAPAERWSVQLAEMLKQHQLNVAQPHIIARTGWTTAELQAGIASSDLATNTYDLVSLLIGVNNQYRGQSVDTYRKEFGALLGTAVRFARGNAKRVFVLSIPDWGVSPFAAGRDKTQIANEIDTFNAIAKEECRRAGIVYIDITPLSRLAAADPTYIANDQLHFSGKMYERWATEALPAVKELLK